MASPPALFISHGAPNLVLHDSPARRFLTELGAQLPPIRGILCLSAHFETALPTVSTDPAPGMIYDFGGFERELRSMVYPASGDPDLAAQVLARFAGAGIEANELPRRGYDHGTWVPLVLLRPEADVPVVQISVVPSADAALHLAMGETIVDLREEGILVIGSGAMTHDLASAFGPSGLLPRHQEAPGWVRDFADWVTEKAEAGDTAALLDWERAPHARGNHPTPEHFLPFFFAMGAGNGVPGKRVHTSPQHGVLMMDVIRWE